MQINEKINQIAEDFSYFSCWEEKYEYIIDLGKKLPPMDEALKTEETKVKGCMSQVWLVALEQNDNKLKIIADSDAIIVRGLIALVLKIFDGASREEIKQVNISELFKKLELDSNIAGTRRNGLASMIEKIKTF